MHQRRRVINHHSSSRLVPTLFPIWQKEKEREERMTVASQFQEGQKSALELTAVKPSSGHKFRAIISFDLFSICMHLFKE